MNELRISRFPTLEYASNEAMNTLCTNLSYCGKDVRAILFTSRYEHEGKSSITMNVMRTMASLGKRVVLVDADLRRSVLARRYKFQYASKSTPGLAQYLAGMNELDDVVYKTDIPGAYIIPSGKTVLNSLQLLVSARYERMMKKLREQFDIVLVDSSPAGVIIDPIEIARFCDGALIVVAYNRGRKQEIGEVADSIAQTGCTVLGAVMNGVDLSSYQNKKYYYRSEKYAYYYKPSRKAGFSKEKGGKDKPEQSRKS